MASDIKSIINNSQLTNDHSVKKYKKQLPLATVDAIADELVLEFSNPGYRSWYCGVIYDFGIAQVQEWRKRAAEGNEPAKLFSAYVTQSRRKRSLYDLSK